MKKLFAVALMVSSVGAFAAPDMDKYAKSCQVCHANGAANAPKTGDAEAWAPRMAKGVDNALLEIAQEQGGMNAEEAGAYIKELRKEKRYCRDVY